MKYCATCGKIIPEGEGQIYQFNEQPDSWLCSICDEEYWSWVLHRPPFTNDLAILMDLHKKLVFESFSRQSLRGRFD